MSPASHPFFTFEHVPSQVEFDLFAAISGDDNPIHVDADFASRSRFGRPVAHGMMLYSLIWARIRMHLPEARHIGQSLMFPNPAYAGEPLRCEARRSGGDDGRIRIEARLFRLADGETVCLSTTEIAGDAP